MSNRISTRIAWIPTKSQDGYILITTLVAMLFCGILTGLMLAVAMSPVAIEESGRVRERQQRAVEGATEIAINTIRNSGSMAAGTDQPRFKDANDPGYDPSVLVPKVSTDPGYDPRFDPALHPELYDNMCNPAPGLIQVEGISVRVTCTNQGVTATDPLTGFTIDGIPTDDGAVAVRLVGGAYQGDATDSSDLARTWKTTFPFSTAMTGFDQTEVNATTGQLVYTGARPLSIVGGLEVKNQIAAVTSTGTDGPAVAVNGTAVTGGLGMFNASGNNGCGISALADNRGAIRSDVAVDSILDPAGEGIICGDSELAVGTQKGLPPGSGDWNNKLVQFFRSTTLPSNCATYAAEGGTISLGGSFDKEQTKILNEWWGGVDDPSTPATPCKNRTFLFSQNVFFDVFNPAYPDSDPRRNSIVLNDSTINWVFGEKTWPGLRPSIADFPKVCNRNAPTGVAQGGQDSSGFDVALSARTGLYHKAGRVVLCGPIQPGSTWTTAISQRSATSLGAQLKPTTMTAESGWFGVPSGTPAAATPIQAVGGTAISRAQSVSTACWDSGTCTFVQPSFTAKGFGDGAPNEPWPGSGPASVVTLEFNGSTDRGNVAGATVRFDLTFVDGTTCDATYPLPSGGTVPFVLTTPSAGNNCNGLLTGIDRHKLYQSSIKVTVKLAAPQISNTTGWRRWGWLCRLLNSFGNFTGWYRLNCDNRPTSISYTVDSIALRSAWSPSVVFSSSTTGLNSPQDNNPGANSRPFNSATVQNAATKDGQFATTNTTTATNANGSVVSRLRYVLRDNNLLDGFLPVGSMKVSAVVRKPVPDNAADYVTFSLRTHSGITCTVRKFMSSFTNDVPLMVDLTPGNTFTDIDNVSKQVCTTGSIDSGELVTYTPLAGGEGYPTATFLDVEPNLKTTGADRTFSLDSATVDATASGFARPLDPFTVTWNPLTPNLDGSARAGDATFNVFGSVSVPDNDVRVIWNWDATNSAGPLGFPIFNGGKVTFDRCNPISKEQCKPALVAAALGSWTTGAWPALATATPQQRPDVLASTGSQRPPIRRVLLTACIIADKGTATEADDELLPRVQAEASITDQSGRVPAIGSKVNLNRWLELKGDVSVGYGAAARTNECRPV